MKTFSSLPLHVAPVLKCTAVLLMAALLVFLPAAAAMGAGPGVISGKVINATTGEPVGGLAVKLEKIQGNQPSGSASAVTSAAGQFQFEGLDTQAGYLITVDYKDVTYDTAGLIFEKDKTGMNVEINVFEPGAQAGSILSKRGHTIIFPEAGGLSVLEYGSLFNIDKKVFMPGESGKQGTLELFLPREAEDVSYIAGLAASNVTRTDKGLTYTGPVKPGQIDVAYGYRVPLTGNSSYIYSRPIVYQTLGYSLLVRGDNLRIESSMLEKQAPVNINNESYQMFVAPELAPGANVMISITATAAALPPAAGGGSSGFSPVFAGVASAVVIVALLAFFFLRRTRPQVAIAPQPDPLASDALIEELARLDDSFEAGRIPEETYRQVRTEKKAQLLRLMQSKE